MTSQTSSSTFRSNEFFSVGVLYTAQELLALIARDPTIDATSGESVSTVAGASPSAALVTCHAAGWVQPDSGGKLRITERGALIVSMRRPESALAAQVGDLIVATTPTWLPLLSRGREEANKYLPTSVRQCLAEAGLFDHPTDTIVSWWDTYSKVSRKIIRDVKLEVGRRGEKLSIEFETRRTGKSPLWRGFESNLLGYDILSSVSSTDPSPLRIEVKSSTSLFADATFHVSRNEWLVASTSQPFNFHIWSFQKPPLLAILLPGDVGQHVPSNCGLGSWETVEIPYAPFSEHITPILPP